MRGGDRVFVLAGLEFDQRHAVFGRKRLDPGHQPVMHGAEQCRRGYRKAEMIAQEVTQTTRRLQLGHVALQIDAIETSDRQRHVIPDNAIDVGRHSILLGRKIDDGTPREHAGHCIGPNIKRPRSGRALKVRRSVQERVAIDLATLPGGSALLLVGLRRSFTAVPTA